MNIPSIKKAIEEKGLWTINENGYYTKIWSEAGHIILRVYNVADDNSYIAETYKQDEQELIWTVKDSNICLNIKHPKLVVIGPGECESDICADKEFEKGAGVVYDAVRVNNNLACRLGSNKTKTFDLSI